MRRRRLALQNLNDEERDQPKERRRDPEEWGGALKQVPPGASEVWQDDEMSYPGSKTRSEQPTDSDVAFFTMGRLVKSVWRRVSQTQMRPRSSTLPNGSTGGGGLVSERKLDATDKISTEREREMESEQEQERQGRNSHEETVKAKQMPSVEEGEALDVLGNASIRLEFKRPVLVRSASEPIGKTTTVASTFR